MKRIFHSFLKFQYTFNDNYLGFKIEILRDIGKQKMAHLVSTNARALVWVYHIVILTYVAYNLIKFLLQQNMLQMDLLTICHMGN